MIREEEGKNVELASEDVLRYESINLLLSRLIYYCFLFFNRIVIVVIVVYGIRVTFSNV